MADFKRGGNRSGAPVTVSRRLALAAVSDVTHNGAYTSEALSRALRSEPAIKPQDRALVAEITNGTIANLAYIDHIISKFTERTPERRVRDILRISVYQLFWLTRVPENAVCDEAVKLVKFVRLDTLAGLVNAVLRNILRNRDTALELPQGDEALRLSVQYSMPEFACRRIIAQYGADAARRILAWGGRRYTVIRPALDKFSPAELEAELARRNVEYARSPFEGLYRIRGLGDIENDELYRRGLIYIQGEASWLCAQAVRPKPGMRVLDACAAPGGKSLAIAQRMQGSGRVFACDIYPHRVDLIRAACRRTHTDTVRAVQQDATVFNSAWENSMDAVLCDVPCSGLGVVDAKPDIKLRLTEAELDSLPGLQSSILANCARYVVPGGRLVYSTCTILQAENQSVVKAFLADHTDFEPEDIGDIVPPELRGAVSDGMLALAGGIDDCEGFFIASLKRKK